LRPRWGDPLRVSQAEPREWPPSSNGAGLAFLSLLASKDNVLSILEKNINRKRFGASTYKEDVNKVHLRLNLDKTLGEAQSSC